MRTYLAAVLALTVPALAAPGNNAAKCWSSWSTWDSVDASLASTPVTVTQEISSTLSCINCQTTGSTVLCDGRTHSNPPETSVWVISTAPIDDPYTVPGSNTAPQPTCTIAMNDCPPFKSRELSSSSVWESIASEGNAPTWRPALAHCNTYSRCPTTSIPTPTATTEGGEEEEPTSSPYCVLKDAGPMTVYFWPIKKVFPSDGCYLNATTVTPTRTGSGPNTAVIQGTTFTSPSVYFKFATIEAGMYRHKRLEGGLITSHCGRTHTNVFVSAHPTAVSSVAVRRWGVSYSEEFDFGDFFGPLPSRAIIAMPYCYKPNTCRNFNPGEWHPSMSIPSVVKTIDPDFKYCTPYYDAGATYVALLPPSQTSIVRVEPWQVTITPAPTPK